VNTIKKWLILHLMLCKISIAYAGPPASSLYKPLKEEADIDAKDAQGHTALIRAAYSGNLMKVNELLQYGADVNAKSSNSCGYTALIWAVVYRHSNVVEVLLKAGASTEVKDAHGNTALMWAAIYGDLGLVKQLLRAQADVETKSSCGKTAPMWAALYGRHDLVKELCTTLPL